MPADTDSAAEFPDFQLLLKSTKPQIKSIESLWKQSPTNVGQNLLESESASSASSASSALSAPIAPSAPVPPKRKKSLQKDFYQKVWRQIHETDAFLRNFSNIIFSS